MVYFPLLSLSCGGAQQPPADHPIAQNPRQNPVGLTVFAKKKAHTHTTPGGKQRPRGALPLSAFNLA